MVHTLVPQKPSSLWANRNFLFLWIGQSFSLLGDWFFVATLTIWIIDRLARGHSWLPLAAGGVPLIRTLPSLLLAPFAGVFVDRWDRRRTMLWTDGLRLVLVTLFLLLVLLVPIPAWWLVSCFGVLLLCACGSQFFDPARVAVITDLVPAAQRPQAFGSLQQANYGAQILGPALAVPLYVALGPAWAITLNAGSFLVSLLALLVLRVPAPEQSTVQEKREFWHEWAEGLRFFTGNRVLVTLLLSGMLFMGAGMACNAFEYLYGVENLHIPAALLGLYVACFGSGVLVGLPLVAALARRLSEVETLWSSLVCYGITTLVLARVSSVIPGMVCGLLLGFFSASIFVTVRPLTVRVTPRQLIGRVLAFEVPLINIASLLGGTLATVLAWTVLRDFHATIAGMTFGRLDTIFLGIGLLAVGAGVFARLTLYRAVKNLDTAEAREQKTPGEQGL